MAIVVEEKLMHMHAPVGNTPLPRTTAGQTSLGSATQPSSIWQDRRLHWPAAPHGEAGPSQGRGDELGTMLAKALKSLRTAFPHSGHFFTGGSSIFCRRSKAWPQWSHWYS